MHWLRLLAFGKIKRLGIELAIVFGCSKYYYKSKFRKNQYTEKIIKIADVQQEMLLNKISFTKPCLGRYLSFQKGFNASNLNASRFDRPENFKSNYGIILKIEGQSLMVKSQTYFGPKRD